MSAGDALRQLAGGPAPSPRPRAPAPPRIGDRHLLAGAVALLLASMAVGAAVGASRLGLFVPPASAGSLGDAAGILRNNLEIWALLAAAALLQPRGIPNLSPGFLPLWLADLAVALAVVVNLIAIGGVLGALGLHALLRIAPHAPLEVGGYLILVAAYLRARRGELSRHRAVRSFAFACGLLVCGAFIESYVSGALA